LRCSRPCSHPANFEPQTLPKPYAPSDFIFLGRFERVAIPSNIFVSREHSSHWHGASQGAANVSCTLLRDWDHIGDNWKEDLAIAQRDAFLRPY
jgi:hypothetical protein